MKGFFRLLQSGFKPGLVFLCFFQLMQTSHPSTIGDKENAVNNGEYGKKSSWTDDDRLLFLYY